MPLIEFSEDLRSRLQENEFALKWVRERHSAMDRARSPWEPIWRDDFDQFSNILIAEKDDWQSKLFIPRTMSTIFTIVPRLVAGMFGSSPFFALLPLFPEQAATIKLRERVIQEQSDNATRIKRLASEQWFIDALVFGTAPAMMTWNFTTGRPVMHLLDVLDYWPDQRARRPEEMRDSMHRVRTSIDEARRMASAGVYDRRAIDALKESSKSDPVKDRLARTGLGGDESSDTRGLDLYEYWGYGRVITVDTNFEQVLRNAPDDLYGGEMLPYFIARAIPLTGSIYWRSIPWALRSLQDEMNDQRNLALDAAKIAACPIIAAPFDLDIATAIFYPGAVWPMASPDLLRPINVPDLSGGLMAQANQTSRDVDSTVGVFEYTRGERSRAGETASGIQAITQEANQRFAWQLDLFSEPCLDAIRRQDKLNQRHLRLPGMVRVWSDQGVEFVKLSEGDYAGDVQVTVSTSGIHGNKDVLRQSRQGYAQLIANVPQLAERADWDSIFKMLNDTMEIPAAYKVRLTEQERQALQMQMMQQAAMQQALMGGGLSPGGPSNGGAPGQVPVPGGPPNNGTAMSAPTPALGPAGNAVGRPPAM